MKLYLNCMQCINESKGKINYKKEVEYNEEGCYYFECSKGHKNFVVLQEQKFETLFQIGAHAIYDGYYREAVSSFTSSLERFYEFCVQIFCRKHNVPIEKIIECTKFYNKSSERQFGSFLFLFLVEFSDLPFMKQEDDKWRNFRNNVIHNGQIPTKEQAIQYGDNIRKLIISIMIKLKENYRKEIEELTIYNLRVRSQQNNNNCPVTTMYNPNIISLVNGNIEKSLKEDFISQIKLMKKLEYGMAIH